MAVEVNTKASLVELGPPKTLFELASGNLSGRYYDIGPDGQKSGVRVPTGLPSFSIT
jgi:hypothetical protein